MPDPVSWLLIEPGWEVVDASGASVGKVSEVLGDRDKDIWDGLQVSSGLTGSDYVASERVASIVEGRVTLSD